MLNMVSLTNHVYCKTLENTDKIKEVRLTTNLTSRLLPVLIFVMIEGMRGRTEGY